MKYTHCTDGTLLSNVLFLEKKLFFTNLFYFCINCLNHLIKANFIFRAKHTSPELFFILTNNAICMIFFLKEKNSFLSFVKF